MPSGGREATSRTRKPLGQVIAAVLQSKSSGARAGMTTKGQAVATTHLHAHPSRSAARAAAAARHSYSRSSLASSRWQPTLEPAM